MPSPDLTPEQNALLEWSRRKFDAAEVVHKRHRPDWDRWDRLYHSRRSLLAAHAGASDRDKPSVVEDARKEFGADLLIPYGFSVLETVLPRALSNRPRMLVTPRNGAAPGAAASPENAENMRVIIDAQQSAADYELTLQDTGRSGFMYGLGVQQIEWRTQTERRKKIARRIHGDVDGQGEYAEVEYDCVLWDDPDARHVSVYDFLWDPYGSCMDTVGYVIHRSWRSTAYVLGKMAPGENGAPAAWPEVPGITAEDLEADGRQEYKTLWSARWSVQDRDMSLKEPIHEIWQIHDGGHRIVTVLNRKWPVAVAPAPAWHRKLPFAIFRPTRVLNQFCGKGEIEPIEDLSREMNALRSDRRWNALMKLHESFFYDDGALDPSQVKIGPGIMNPVTSGGIPLRDLIHPVTVGDIPNSGYQEEDALQRDIERVSGISDPVSGGSGAEQTATGVQLIQAAAGMRIQLKTRRLELETIRPTARIWVALNQQRITSERMMRFPAAPTAEEPDRRWSWRKIGPLGLAGEMDIEPDGGSTAPDNVPQMRQDAQMQSSLIGLPGVDPRKMVPHILENSGIKDPESVMLPEVHIPPPTLDLIAAKLMEGGMDQEAVNQLVSASLNEALSAEEQGGGQQMPAEPEQPPEQAAA